jgi:hypothetical protein
MQYLTLTRERIKWGVIAFSIYPASRACALAMLKYQRSRYRGQIFKVASCLSLDRNGCELVAQLNKHEDEGIVSLGQLVKICHQIQEIQEIMLRRSKIQFAVSYSIGYLGQSIYPFPQHRNRLSFTQMLQWFMYNFIESK